MDGDNIFYKPPASSSSSFLLMAFVNNFSIFLCTLLLLSLSGDVLNMHKKNFFSLRYTRLLFSLKYLFSLRRKTAKDLDKLFLFCMRIKVNKKPCLWVVVYWKKKKKKRRENYAVTLVLVINFKMSSPFCRKNNGCEKPRFRVHHLKFVRGLLNVLQTREISLRYF